MKKVVLDTNVLVSGLLVSGSIPARVLQQFRDGQWQLAVSGTILEEYGRVLRRPRLGLPLSKIESILQEVELRSLAVIPSQRYTAISADPSDNEFLDVAVECAAACIVSGDHHLLDLKLFHGIPIYTPTQFLERM